LAIANGVIVVAYFGLGLQFFHLRFGRRGANYLSLFLFLVWVVPLIAGTIYALADFTGQQQGPALIIYAISPLAGLGLATGAAVGAGINFMAVAGAAITPSLLFAFVFNGLVSAAGKRVQRAVLIAEARATAATPGLLTKT
jgi:hypothetical protein